MFQVLNFSEMGTHIRIAWRANYKILSVVLECISRLQVKILYQLQACTHTFCSVLFVNIAYSGEVITSAQHSCGEIINCRPVTM